jgi:ligand-binding sensor domain-containing protein
MSRAAALSIALVAFGASAAASTPDVVDVHTDVGEARACLPLAAGGALVGTGGGLIRVDAVGAVTGVWTATEGLPGTRIESIVELGSELWIGTDAGAAKIALGDAADKITIARSVASRPVRDLARIGDTIYVATWDGGVRRLGASRPIAFTGTVTGARARVSSLAVVEGTLYAGTAAGLFRLERGRLVPVRVDGLAAGAAIASLQADGDRLWIATPEGLFARAADGSVRDHGGGDLRDLAALDGAIVAAGVADGLDRVDRGRLVNLAGAPRELVVAQTVATRGDAMCAGGLAGVWLRGSAGAAWVHAAHRAGPPSNDISALAADGDRLWVGTFDRGVAVRERGSWRTIEHAEIDARVNAIVVEPRPGKPARIWIATANGLSTIDGDDVTRLARRDGLPGRGVLSLARLRDGRMLVGTSYGAVIVSDGRPARLGPKASELAAVWAVAEDADGALWLGTTTGLYRGDDTAGEWKRFSLATGDLRDDWVTALVTRDRALYAGTYKGGVTRFDVGASVTVTQLGEGWINPNGLALDGETLLAATMDGLRVGDGATAAWTTLARLPGKDATAAARIGKTLYVSTRRGLAELR